MAETMKILWFSEIPWNYLRTRKQQVLRYLSVKQNIVFVEPISKHSKCTLNGKYNKLIYTTVPQIRTTQSKIISKIFSIRIVRIIIHLISSFWISLFLWIKGFKPNIIVVSNVYWLHTAYIFKRILKIHLVYDCNDNPLAFHNTPDYKKYYFRKLNNITDTIVLPHKSYLGFIPKPFYHKVVYIPNGVDYQLFNQNKNINKQITHEIIYVGAIDTWFDFDTVSRLATKLNHYKILLIGPVNSQVNQKLELLLKHKNVYYHKAVNHEKLPYFIMNSVVGIIPFIKTTLTKSVLPNKMFEYASCGIPSVLTNFNLLLSEYVPLIQISKDTEDFISHVDMLIKSPPNSTVLKLWALKFDWKHISDEFYSLLKELID